ncbi:hypothetical protein DFH06DRAFT_1146624 [Mycena polygramma]|nr:hypothetical protein DFH06DRAFT_1146624 [Mycena polygramma]
MSKAPIHAATSAARLFTSSKRRGRVEVDRVQGDAPSRSTLFNPKMNSSLQVEHRRVHASLQTSARKLHPLKSVFQLDPPYGRYNWARMASRGGVGIGNPKFHAINIIIERAGPHPFGSVDFELAPISTFQREIITRITHPQTSSNLLQCIPTNPTSSYIKFIKFIKRAMKFQPSGLFLLQFLRRTPIHITQLQSISTLNNRTSTNLVAKRIKRAR